MGRLEDFYATNVTGTDNVLAACDMNDIRRLVFTSSPAVVHAGGDLEGVDESRAVSRALSRALPGDQGDRGKARARGQRPDARDRRAASAPDLGPGRQPSVAAAGRARARRAPALRRRRPEPHRHDLHRQRGRRAPRGARPPRHRRAVRGPRLLPHAGPAHADRGRDQCVAAHGRPAARDALHLAPHRARARRRARRPCGACCASAASRR